MTQDMQVRFAVYQGPSPMAPFPAVLAEFQPPSEGPLDRERLLSLMEALLPEELSILPSLPGESFTFAGLAAAFAQGICDRHGPWAFRQRILESKEGPTRILLEHLIPPATLEALMAGLELANLLLQHGAGHAADPAPCLARVQRHLNRWDVLHSDPSTLGQMRIARQRGIPVYEVASAPRFRLFGQGASGHLVECTADDRDGYSGCQLAIDKALGNELVRRLGFPGVENRSVRDPQEALAAARQLGFPVVVKPRSGDMGHGVTTGITREPEVIQAYRHAVESHPGPVLIERHVDGEVHRLVVLGGRFAWALRYTRARVIGDGLHTVAELLAEENARRAAAATRPAPRQLHADTPMLTLLQRQGFTLASRPEAGHIVELRATSNWITGGTAEVVSDQVHPDNRALAEGLARAFRLGATGIDFIAPDIGRSWREGGCAVLEVNPTPGMGSDEQIEALMAARFPGGSSGRVPTVLLLGLPPAAAEQVQEALTLCARRTGLVSHDTMRLGDACRNLPGDSLSLRIRGLFLDPGCQALVVSQDPAEAEEQGLPLDHFDVVVLGEAATVHASLQALAEAAGGTSIPWTGPGTVSRILAALPLQP